MYFQEIVTEVSVTGSFTLIQKEMLLATLHDGFSGTINTIYNAIFTETLKYTTGKNTYY